MPSRIIILVDFDNPMMADGGRYETQMKVWGCYRDVMCRELLPLSEENQRAGNLLF